MEYECGSLKRNSSVPPSLFLFLSLFFLFYFYFLVASMDLSISLICPLWYLFILSSLGTFPHFRGNTLYITRSIEDLSHVTKVLNHKENETIMMYANVCL